MLCQPHGVGIAALVEDRVEVGYMGGVCVSEMRDLSSVDCGNEVMLGLDGQEQDDPSVRVGSQYRRFRRYRAVGPFLDRADELVGEVGLEEHGAG